VITINSYGGVSLHEQSHGESFWALVMKRFGGQGLYILDEPEAALSPNKQMALITRIHDLVSNGSQFIIATHSPIVMSYPNSRLYQLADDEISTIKYEDTEHFLVTKEFLNNHERMLSILME
jgi:predicted ATPase